MRYWPLIILAFALVVLTSVWMNYHPNNTVSSPQAKQDFLQDKSN